MPESKQHWNLYWLDTPDSTENRFVMAKTAREAKILEQIANGFELKSIATKRIMRLPAHLAKKELQLSKRSTLKTAIYASDELLDKLGRTIIQRDGIYIHRINNHECKQETFYAAYVPQLIATSLEEIESFISQLPPGKWIYRGHSNCTWKTQSKINRLIDSKELTPEQAKIYEKSILKQFKKKAEKFISVPPKDDWEWLALAQHHGLPTRILDWTNNPYVAAFFATYDTESDQDARLYAMDLKDAELNQEEEKDPLQMEKIKIFRPLPIVDRIRLQHSVFTVEPVPLKNSHARKGQGQSVYIAHGSIDKIRKQLKQKGFSQSSLRPSLDSVAMEIYMDATLKKNAKKEKA